VAANKSGTISDVEVLEFYNLATGRLLRGLEVSNDIVLILTKQFILVYSRYLI